MVFHSKHFDDSHSDRSGIRPIRWLWLFLGCALYAGIWYFSSRNGSQSQLQSDRVLDLFSLPNTLLISFFIRKAAHFLIYCLLGCIWALYFHSPGCSARKTLCLAFLLSAGYAAIDELHQHFVPGRSGEIRDVLLDSLGALIGILGIRLLLRRTFHHRVHEESSDGSSPSSSENR